MDIFDKIEKLQQSSEYYYIDYLPEKCMGDRFYEFEEYFFSHNLNSFCDKVSNVVITLLAYYDASGVMTEFPDGYTGKYRSLYEDSMDIAKDNFDQISDLIHFVLINEISSIQLLMGKDKDMLFSINNRNSIEVINATSDQLDLVQKLVMQEGLYLRKDIEE